MPKTGMKNSSPKRNPQEHAPGRSGADRVMAGVDVVAGVLVPRDHRDRVGLDDQIGGQATCLVGGGVRGRLIRISDGDQVSHGVPFFSWCPFGHH
jgi:hypothetical protein